VTLQVALVIPEGEIWAGPAQMVSAKTREGDIGLMTGHAPVLGILVEGSLVKIRPEDDAAEEVTAAVDGGFLSIAADRVSILARQARLGADIDTAAAQSALDTALEAAGGQGEETPEIRYYRAQLRAAGAGS
jgi:F-type H+-transporting ATPase subunit epsilon